MNLKKIQQQQAGKYEYRLVPSASLFVPSSPLLACLSGHCCQQNFKQQMIYDKQSKAKQGYGNVFFPKYKQKIIFLVIGKTQQPFLIFFFSFKKKNHQKFLKIQAVVKPPYYSNQYSNTHTH